MPIESPISMWVGEIFKNTMAPFQLQQQRQIGFFFDGASQPSLMFLLGA